MIPTWDCYLFCSVLLNTCDLCSLSADGHLSSGSLSKLSQPPRCKMDVSGASASDTSASDTRLAAAVFTVTANKTVFGNRLEHAFGCVGTGLAVCSSGRQRQNGS